MRLLLIDIETAPIVAYVWKLWDQNIPAKHIVEDGYTLCYAARWYGSEEVMFDSIKRSGMRKMLESVHKLLSEADAVITYNGKSFDVPVLNTEFLLHKIRPPAPFKHIDLYRVVGADFRFHSKKLDYISKRLGYEGKVENRGMDLWKDCMAGNDAAWVEMETYNRGDVIVLESVYEDLRPWIRVHPNAGLYDEPGLPVCPNCGSGHLQRRGYAHTPVQKYARFQCMGCGKWMRDTMKELPREDTQAIMRPIA